MPAFSYMAPPNVAEPTAQPEDQPEGTARKFDLTANSDHLQQPGACRQGWRSLISRWRRGFAHTSQPIGMIALATPCISS